MSTVELLDDFEAGELSVEFEGREPSELLEWALDQYGDGLALSRPYRALDRGCLGLDELGEEPPGIGLGMPGDLLGRSGCDYLAARFATLRAQVHDPVG